MNTQLAQKAFLIGALSLVALSTLGSATSSHVDEAASGDRRRQIEERELGPGRQTPLSTL